jgi:hypothetical protein
LVAKTRVNFKFKGFATRSHRKSGIGYRAGKSDTPLGIVVVAISVSSQIRVGKYFDDPRLRCRWRLARGISMRFDEMEIPASIGRAIFSDDNGGVELP